MRPALESSGKVHGLAGARDLVGSACSLDGWYLNNILMCSKFLDRFSRASSECLNHVYCCTCLVSMHDDIHVNIDCMCNIDTIYGICTIYNMDKIVCTYHIYDKDKRDWRDNIYDKDKRD
jgi:hypothetical protein